MATAAIRYTTEKPMFGSARTSDAMPLTNITVSVDSLIVGGTKSTIDCDAAADPPFDFTTPVSGDGSFSLNYKQPETYTCVIVVDP